MRPRPGGEDVEDHLGPVDHLDAQELLQVPGLRGAEVVVEDDEVGLVRLDQLLELLDLARADVGGDVDLLPLLEHAADHDQTGRLGQAPDLVQGVVGRDLAVGAGSRRPGSTSPADRDARCSCVRSSWDLTSFPRVDRKDRHAFRHARIVESGYSSVNEEFRTRRAGGPFRPRCCLSIDTVMPRRFGSGQDRHSEPVNPRGLPP